MKESGSFLKQFHDCMPLFIALGDEVRLSILEALTDQTLSTGKKGMNVKQITEQTNLSRPAISHHLKILKDAGIIDVLQEGTSNYYYLTVKDCHARLMSLGEAIKMMTDVRKEV